MSVEQAHQRLEITEGVIHEVQEQLQRVSAGHQAMHQESSALRSQANTRSRVRLVEPKTLMPDRFGKKNGPSWRTWSHLTRDFVGVVHATLKAAENQKQPISVTYLQHEFNVTNEMDHDLQHFLISRTEGEALEIVRGAEREPGLEKWRRLAALYDPLAAGRSLDDSRQILSPPKAAKIDDPTDLEKELTAQQPPHLDFAQMKARIVTVINGRTRGLAPMMMRNLSDEDSCHHAGMENCTAWTDIRNGKKVFPKSRHEPSKGNG